MNDPEVQWTTAPPLWASLSDLSDGTRQLFRRPALLRFASDDFMTQFTAVLNSQPGQLKDFRALPETWRGPEPLPEVTAIDQMPRLGQQLFRARQARQAARAPAAALLLRTATAAKPLKLYQPAHQRYYLVGAALVCRLPGQPDRHIETSQQERVTFVVRKVVPPNGRSIFDTSETDWQEYAFVHNGWQLVSNAYALAANEDQNPLFTVNYPQPDGRRRRVLAGLVPTGKREAYAGAPQQSSTGQTLPDPDVPPPPEPRMLLFMQQVTEAWKRLIEGAFAWQKMQSLNSPDNPPTPEQLRRSLKDTREHMQTVSWYALLDLANLLKLYMPNVWASIMNQAVASPLTPAQQALVNTLSTISLSPTLPSQLTQFTAGSLSSGFPVSPAAVESNLLAALQSIQGGLPFNAVTASNLEKSLEGQQQHYDRNPNPAGGASTWPSFLFPLADPAQFGPLPPAEPGVAEDPDPLTAALKRVDYLARLIAAALPAVTTEKLPAPVVAAQPVMRLDAQNDYVIRCVFERPNCGPLQPTLLSPPTEPFLMAGFFDPDAPARPIRIGLPVDTTPAGLRKFDKNTAFMMSDVLCGQVERAKSLGLSDLVLSVLPFPFHKDLDVPDGGPCVDGLICSLSIPIITICALILLMIMVNLLDIIFHWVPYFIFCLPLPKFEGKPAT